MEESVIKNVISNYNTPVYVFDINILKKRIEYLIGKNRKC